MDIIFSIFSISFPSTVIISIVLLVYMSKDEKIKMKKLTILMIISTSLVFIIISILATENWMSQEIFSIVYKILIISFIIAIITIFISLFKLYKEKG